MSCCEYFVRIISRFFFLSPVFHFGVGFLVSFFFFLSFFRLLPPCLWGLCMRVGSWRWVRDEAMKFASDFGVGRVSPRTFVRFSLGLQVVPLLYTLWYKLPIFDFHADILLCYYLKYWCWINSRVSTKSTERKKNLRKTLSNWSISERLTAMGQTRARDKDSRKWFHTGMELAGTCISLGLMTWTSLGSQAIVNLLGGWT